MSEFISLKEAIATVKEAYENDEMFDGYEYRLNELPSTEIIHCLECKYAEMADKDDNQDGYTCLFHRGNIWFSGSYCSWGEKKEEE